MCRALMYFGKPILIDDLLFKTASSLIKKIYDPKYMSAFKNLAGFGLAAWNKDSYQANTPYLYKTRDLPLFDTNLKHFATKTIVNSLIAHVRGTPDSERAIMEMQNLHPFVYENCKIVMAHNGDLAHFKRFKYKLLDWIKPEIAENIEGTTDSEWIYALILSQLDDPYADNTSKKVVTAVLKSIEILRIVRRQCHIDLASRLNLFIGSNKFLIATRFVFDFGHFIERSSKNIDDLTYQSLWYTVGSECGFDDGEYKMLEGGKKSSIIVSSEPLTTDVSTWVELPEYSIMTVQSRNGHIKVDIVDIP